MQTAQSPIAPVACVSRGDSTRASARVSCRRRVNEVAVPMRTGLIVVASVLLVGCSPGAFIDMEVSGPDGTAVPGAALTVHDAVNFKLHAEPDARGCLHAYGTVRRMGGRDWRLKVASPGSAPAETRMHAAGRKAYRVTLQPAGSGLDSTIVEVGALQRCAR